MADEKESLICENCGSNNLTNEDGVLTCQACGSTFTDNVSKIKSAEDKRITETFEYIREERKKKEIKRLMNLYSKKNKNMAINLNIAFPGLGLLYVGSILQTLLGIVLTFLTILIYVGAYMLITSMYAVLIILYIVIIAGWMGVVGYFSINHIFEPSNILNDDEVLKYAPDSDKAKMLF
ncbi:MAG: TFIIB-type zinc finger domain-containing protein [Methanobrevibacter sp.]|jgi:hypothetical protein|nr:TFIIB-type zinc finger domain-containing protein [Candidatus Methanovirga meridionalis]